MQISYKTYKEKLEKERRVLPCNKIQKQSQFNKILKYKIENVFIAMSYNL